MAASRFLVVLFMTLVQLSYTNTDAFVALRAGPAASGQEIDTKLADTVRALDTNGNGKVDKSELAGFAKSQGLSSEEVMGEFAELDVNHDGALDASEIGPLFGADEAQAKTVAVEPPAASPDASAIPGGSTEPVSAVVAPKAIKEHEVLKETASADADFLSNRLGAGVAPEMPTQEKDAMGLDLVALERDSQEQAGGIIASGLAQRAQILLARSAADEHKAEAFDSDVRTLRGNATALAKSANGQAREAARAASAGVSQKALAKLDKLREEEHKAAVAADERRDEARKAMARVRKAQASLRKS